MKPFNIEVMLYLVNLEKVAGCKNWALELSAKGPQGQGFEWCETFTTLEQAVARFGELSGLLHDDEVDC